MTVVTSVAQRLAQAEAALHQLRIGKASVVVKVDGREVHYKPSTIEALRAYVADLRREAAGECRRPGAIGILFG